MARFSDLTFTQVAILVVAYWTVALIVTHALHRHRAQAAQPEHYEQISDTEIAVTFSETIHLGRFAVVAFGPPLVLIVVWYLF